MSVTNWQDGSVVSIATVVTAPTVPFFLECWNGGAYVCERVISGTPEALQKNRTGGK
jgi:hypothetical protein